MPQKTVIDATEMNTGDLSGASIYLDACFVLAFLSKNDPRFDRVADALDFWSDFENVTLGLSNHTFAEVVNRIFQMLVLGSLEAYHVNKDTINRRPDGYTRLSEQDKEKLLDLDGAKFLYRMASNLDMAKFRGGECLANVNQVIKRAKEDQAQRHKLSIYYGKAVEIFNQFSHEMQSGLGFVVEFLGDEPRTENDLAKVHMRLMQLDAVDSLHLAIAHINQYDFLATLDSDFVHDFYTEEFLLKIVKVA